MEAKKVSAISALLLITVLTGVNLASSVPDTGQTQSYTGIWGEDSDYIINPPSYTKLDSNGNELPDLASSWVTVRDNVTGLIWENKTADGSMQDKNNTYSWENAQNVFIPYLNSINFGGFSDWRMPNVKELTFITNKGARMPIINNIYFTNTQTSWYWSSTSCSNSPESAWVVHFGVGFVKEYTKSNGNYVRAVRGDSSLNNFIENNYNGTVTDISTGLIWQKDTAPGKYTWEEALLYCENLALASYNDWRLPNVNEQQSLVNYSRLYPSSSIDTAFFPDTQREVYWSSTSGPNIPSTKTFSVDFGRGQIAEYGKSNNYYVRAVRGGHIGPSGDWDSDGVFDEMDNCKYVYNPDHTDTDSDGVGDICDNCSTFYNPDQADYDHDGFGDMCDPCPYDSMNDEDGDGICGNVDNCPHTANPNQIDFDGDGIGDMCDPCPYDSMNDEDGDGICGNVDNCPHTANFEQTDSDNDGSGNACDNCSNVYNPDQADSDGDSLGDACDTYPYDSMNDEDGDGISGDVDNCPHVYNPDQIDSDGDGLGDACDNCPTVVSPNPADSDNDGLGDACDNCLNVVNFDQNDYDGDGLGDACDNCPSKPNGATLGTCFATSDNPGITCSSDADCVIGCSSNGLCDKYQTDSDGDGIGDVCDNCPNDPQHDSDSDGICNDVDNCPTVSNPDQADSDGDGVGNACDYKHWKARFEECQNLLTTTTTSTPPDTDADGYLDNIDNCPANCNILQLDADNDGIGDVCDPQPNCGGNEQPQCEQECVKYTI